MSMKPWWSRACCGTLGNRATIVAYTPDPVGENRFIVTFEYTDWDVGCDVTLRPAELLLPLPPAGPLEQLDRCRWRVYGVPQDSYIVVLMRATNGSAAMPTMYFRGANARCRHLGTVVNLAQEVGATGAACIAFKWETTGSFPHGFVYTLNRIAGPNALVSGMAGALDRDARRIFINLPEDQPGDAANQLYSFTLRGACNADGTQTGEAVSTVGFTLPAPALGTQLTILNTAGDESNANVTFEYTDYYCVDPASISITIQNPVDTEAVEHESGNTWLLVNGPRGGTVNLIISAAVDAAGCSCTTEMTLNVRTQITVAALPVTPCADITITGLECTSQTATCLVFAWDRQPELAAYFWEIALASSPESPVQTGSIGQVPNDPTVYVSNLEPRKEYRFQVQGLCQGDITPYTPFTSLTAQTLQGNQPRLPDFGLLGSGDSITFVTETPGTVDVYIAYNGWECVSLPTLYASLPSSSITTGYGVWIIHNVPNGITFTAYFEATEYNGACTTDCVGDGRKSLKTKSFTIKTPPSSCVPIPIHQLVFKATGATCLSAGWNVSSSAYSSFSYSIKRRDNGALIKAQFNVKQRNFNVTLDAADGVQPRTSYTFTVQPACVLGGSAGVTRVFAETSAYVPPALQHIPAPAENDWVTMDGGAHYTLILHYPLAFATCVTDLTLNSLPSHGVINGPVTTGADYVWTIPGFLAGETVELVLSATSAAGCSCAPLTVPVQTLAVTAPPTPPTPPTPPPAAPYLLSILNYAGPPQMLGQVKLEGDIGVINGAGNADTLGSYLNQWKLHDMYAHFIVNNFVYYNAQVRTFTCNRQPYSPPSLQPISYHLPIAAIYYGVAGDPTQQGASSPTGLNPEDLKASRAYAFCDSSALIVNNSNPFKSFRYPPMIAFFVRLITYNWNVASQCEGYKSNPRQIKLALTMYGSKKPGEQWFFNAAITDDPSGEIITLNPSPAILGSDPKSVPSVVNDIPADGNLPPGTTYNNQFAGWNCMERWFMYVGYVNQQLRKIIDAGFIVNVEGAAMVLDDIVDDTAVILPDDKKVWASCCQISALTTDGEGNGFDNANYTPPPPADAGNNWKPPPADLFTNKNSNAAMVALWDKWVNQATTFNPPDGWPPGWREDLHAPAPRILMPTVPFTLPCAMSMTTPGLLPQMTTNDLGTEDCSGINAIFNEIYDTSDNKPFRYLCPLTKSPDSNAVLTAAAPFTPEIHVDAIPTSSAARFANRPVDFALTYGVWDNLVPGALDDSPYTANLCALPSSQEPCANVGNTASYTAFTTSDKPWSPLMETSLCNPWQNAGNPWYLEYNATCDSSTLAWALESSRYDLYNGCWAAKLLSNSLTTEINYSAVQQHAQGHLSDVDGALIWADLSTGLKPRVASRLKEITSSTAASRMVWMLSTQSGPFVNNAGVRFSKRPAPPSGTAPAGLAQSDWLTFTCPITLLQSPETDLWPGWPNMAGQWYGPGTAANAGITVKYALDQFFIGERIGVTQNGPVVQPVIPTGSTEDNFGVFADMAIIEAAWARMALDLRGETIGTDGNQICPDGLYSGQSAKYTDDVPVNLGCYELAYVPLSWCRLLQSYTPLDMTPT
jgi:hypothetical protein